MRKISKKIYLPLIFMVALFLGMFVVGFFIPEQTIRELMEKAGPYGVLLLIFLLWLTNVFAPLSGSPFLFAGFYLYGQTSVFYAFVAAVIASVTNFCIARVWGRGKYPGQMIGKDDKLNDGDITRWVHRVGPEAAIQPYRAALRLGDLADERTLIAIGQSRHLGGGLLVPVDLPTGDLA